MKTTDRTARCGTRCTWEDLTSAMETCRYEGVPVQGIKSSRGHTYVMRTDGVCVKFDQQTGIEVARQAIASPAGGDRAILGPDDPRGP